MIASAISYHDYQTYQKYIVTPFFVLVMAAVLFVYVRRKGGKSHEKLGTDRAKGYSD